MLVRLKAYRWLIAGILAVLIGLGSAMQTGLVSSDLGGMVSLSVVSSMPAPSNLSGSVYDVSIEGFKLTWKDNTSNETAFYIESRKPFRNAFGMESPGIWSRVGTVKGGVTAYNRTGVSDNSTYCYRVQAGSAAGESSYSNEVCGTTRPLSASDVNVVLAGDGHKVTWQDRASVETAYWAK